MGQEVVVDASAFVELLLYGNQPPPAVDIAGDVLIAPTIVDYEFLSSARRVARVAPSKLLLAQAAITAFVELTIERHDATQFLPRMWTFRDNMSAYDASYVALAESLEVPLLTADQRLARAATPYCEVIVYR